LLVLSRAGALGLVGLFDRLGSGVAAPDSTSICEDGDGGAD
jgi:hypothetical protein